MNQKDNSLIELREDLEEDLEEVLYSIAPSKSNAVKSAIYGIGRQYYRHLIMSKNSKYLRLLEDDIDRSIPALRDYSSTSLPSCSPHQVTFSNNELARNPDHALSALKRCGFFVVDDLFKDLAQQLNQELHLLRDTPNILIGQSRGQIIFINIPQCCQLSSFLREMAFSSKIISILKRILATKYFLHMDEIFIKPKQVGVGTSWHQDSAYYRPDYSLGAITVWIAINDATEENGSIRVVPGSHHGQYPHAQNPIFPLQLMSLATPSNSTLVELKAGGALFMSYGLLHKTGDNPTDADRAALSLHYFAKAASIGDCIFPGRHHRIYPPL